VHVTESRKSQAAFSALSFLDLRNDTFRKNEEDRRERAAAMVLRARNTGTGVNHVGAKAVGGFTADCGTEVCGAPTAPVGGSGRSRWVNPTDQKRPREKSHLVRMSRTIPLSCSTHPLLRHKV
jgi:hypothetical protein